MLESHHRKLSILYEIIMIVFAILSIIPIFLKNPPLYWDYLDNIIVCIFITDYIVRFILAKDKKYFFKHNLIDLISSLPFNAIFKGFRLFKIFRFAKIMRIAKLSKLIAVGLRIMKHIEPFLKTNNFIYVLYFTITTTGLGTIAIKYIENMSWSNAIWWTIVTLTTVGYGDISPKTTLGKLIAVILMVVGIGCISMLTGTIATFFLNKNHKTVQRTEINKIIDLSNMNDEQFQKVKDYIDMVENYYK